MGRQPIIWGDFSMVNLLNEEIRAIKHTIEHKRKMSVLEVGSGKRQQLKKDIQELQEILEDKLNKASDG